MVKRGMWYEPGRSFWNAPWSVYADAADGESAVLNQTRMRDCFRILASHRVIPGALAERFKRLAKFRNGIVHEYAHLHLGKVQAALRRLRDFDLFRKHVARFAKLI